MIALAQQKSAWVINMSPVCKFIKPYFKKNSKSIIAYSFVSLVIWAIGIVSPYISGVYIDFLVSKAPVRIILYFLILIGFVSVVRILTQYFSSRVSTKLNNKLLYEIYDDAYQHIFNSHYSTYMNMDRASLIDRIGNDAASVVEFFTGNLVNFFLQIITVITCAVILFKSNLLLCSIIFALLPIYIISYKCYRKKLYAANENYKKETNKYFSKRAEQINKIEYIKRNMLFSEMQERLSIAFNSMYSKAVAQIKINYVFNNLNQFIFIICYLSVVGIGGYMVLLGELTIGYFTMINTYFSMIIGSTSFFLNLASLFQDTKVSIDRLNEIYSAPREQNGDVRPRTLDTIELNNLFVKYETNYVISDLNFTFKSGNIYGICGNNGSGKTTLLNTVMGIYSDLYSGSIKYNNFSMAEIDMSYVRRSLLSYMEQTPEFFNLSISEYLRFGIDVTPNIEREQHRLVDLFGLDKYSMDAVINENGSNFSGGEKQKLSLVRALSKDSLILILDEPTSSLDSISIQIILDELSVKKEGRIVIIVSHDERLIRQCDAVLKLK